MGEDFMHVIIMIISFLCIAPLHAMMSDDYDRHSNHHQSELNDMAFKLIDNDRYGAGVCGLATLLVAGVDKYAKKSDGNSLLAIACRNGEGAPYVQFLLKDAGVDIVQDAHGWKLDWVNWTALHGYADHLRLLVAAGADVNKHRGSGYTPLNSAVEFQQEACMDILLEAGADPNIKYKQDKASVLHRAALYKQAAWVERLLAAGADPNVKDSQSNTPLYIACVWCRSAHRSVPIILCSFSREC
jgi:ankyrin repeat protein